MTPDWLMPAVAAGAILLAALVAIVSQRAARANTAGLAAAEAARRELESEMSRLRDALSQKEGESSGLREAVRRLEAEKTERAEQLHEITQRLSEARDAQSAQLTEIETLKLARDKEREHAQERLRELTEAREKMGKEFRLLAEEVMEKHGQTFKQQNREQIDGLLNPLRQKIVEFQSGMTEAQKQAAEGRARLAEQIRHLSEHSSKMTAETVNLTRALKGESQVRGAWGEMILTRILEASGLREGEEFVTQESETLEGGARLRPDAIVNLPGGKKLIIDSKVSLVAYEQYVNAETEVERAARLRDHVTAVKTHIQQLSKKDYTQIAGITPDYVIMFVPIEGAFAAALEGEPDLTETGLRLNIMFAAPTTLMTLLRSVAHMWQVDRQQKNVEEIASRAGALYDKFVGFTESLDDVGKHLRKASEAHEEATKRLSTGRGNLVNQTEDLRRLGARAKKRLSEDLVEDDAPLMLDAADD